MFSRLQSGVLVHWGMRCKVPVRTGEIHGVGPGPEGPDFFTGVEEEILTALC